MDDAIIDEILSNQEILLNEAILLLQGELESHDPFTREDIEEDLFHAFME